MILPDLDLSMDRRGVGRTRPCRRARGRPAAGQGRCGHPSAISPQAAAQPHGREPRRGRSRGTAPGWAGPPERSHAISNLFLPPEASQGLGRPAGRQAPAGRRAPDRERRIPEEEAQAIALLVRQARRRAGAAGGGGHARSRAGAAGGPASAGAGTSRPTIPPGARCRRLRQGGCSCCWPKSAPKQAAPVPLMALLEHPLVRLGEERGAWLDRARALELQLRGPRPAPGLEPLREAATEAARCATGGARSRRSLPR